MFEFIFEYCSMFEVLITETLALITHV
ncbi:hypothetical protein VCRA217O317_20206 [Vibrio crassostreae]|nr:hypothetical protein VCRA217O317_20206 [Vibrio crassostreae]